MGRVVCVEEPQLPSAAARRGAAVCARDLDAIVGKALRKEPERRYASPEELSDDIGRYLEGLPMTAREGRPDLPRPPGRPEEQGRRRHGRGHGSRGRAGLRNRSSLGSRGRHRRRPTPPGAITSLAVLPLANLSRDPEQEYFADGMTEALIADLSRIESLRVVSRTSVMRYKGTTKPLPEVARELRVDGVVEGSVLHSGNRVRITAQLIRAADDRHLWAQSYDRELRDILTVQGDVAHAIAAEIKGRLTTEEGARLTSRPAVNPKAYLAYVRGRYFWNRRSEAP